MSVMAQLRAQSTTEHVQNVFSCIATETMVAHEARGGTASGSDIDEDTVRRGAMVTVSGRPVRAGARVLFAAPMSELAQFVQSSDVLALVPHLSVRFGDGPFAELSGLKALPHSVGAGFADEPLAAYTAIVDVPSQAVHIELFARFERWHYERQVLHDRNDQITLATRAPDGFVSNLGKNFVLGVR
jgi:hypothetical protein